MKFLTPNQRWFLVASFCGLLVFILVKFSKIESRYECIGTLHYGDKIPMTLNINIIENRWAELFNEKLGCVYVEEPGKPYDQFEITRKDLHVLILKHRNTTGSFGRFSTLSNTLEIKWNGGVFTGKGTLIPN